MTSETLSNLSHEERRFPPPADLAAAANVKAEAYAAASQDFEGFWQPRPTASTGARSGTASSTGTTRRSPSGSRAAPSTPRSTASIATSTRATATRSPSTVGEPEDDTRDITYAQLQDEVNKATNALVSLGVTKGDRVAIYLPMIPECVFTMLACARLGAPHTVIFGGFSADALASRITDCGAKVVVTSDGGYRRGAPSA